MYSSELSAADDPPVGGHVLIVSAGVGAGHDGAAVELARRLRARGVGVEVRDYLEALPGWAGRLLRDGYSPIVQYTPWLFEWIFTSLERRRWAQSVAAWFCGLAQSSVRGWVGGADVIVSTYPLASQTLGQLRQRGQLVDPVVTFLTDPAAHRTWIHPSVDEHLTVTAATAAHAAAHYPVSLRAVGALTEPRFRDAVESGRRRALRRELGVEGLPVVLMSAGSLGIGRVPDTVDAVLHHPRVRVVVLCGRNGRLRQRLERRERVVALGWRRDIPELMAAADVLVHNAGGLSFTEALVAGLPAITYLPIPGHGRANAAVLAEAALAPWPTCPAGLAEAIDTVCAHPRSRPAARSVLRASTRPTSSSTCSSGPRWDAQTRRSPISAPPEQRQRWTHGGMVGRW